VLVPSTVPARPGKFRNAKPRLRDTLGVALALGPAAKETAPGLRPEAASATAVYAEPKTAARSAGAFSFERNAY
jgi:hypothetical protein